MDYSNTRGSKALDHAHHQAIALFVLLNKPLNPPLKKRPHLFFSFYLSFLSNPIVFLLYHYFLQIFKDYIWGGRGNNNKHTSWQTCVCANSILEGCLNTLTMRRSQKSNSKHALLYFEVLVSVKHSNVWRKKKPSSRWSVAPSLSVPQLLSLLSVN